MIHSLATPEQWIFGFLLVMSSLGILLTSKPVQASLCFLLSLLCLAALYVELSAKFIAAMQILVYAGAILVIFMFVIVLFQDAHYQVHRFKPQSSCVVLALAALTMIPAFIFFGYQLLSLPSSDKTFVTDYGTVHSLGRLLYVDFFFPFEAVILIFLVAVIGALYIGRKEQ
jgi:NADH-quinone oxidoreductase subunit J